MAKYTFFVSSDIHGAYTPWMNALNKAGFDQNNDKHKIIVCGDLFDRMNETQKVYDFAMDMIVKGKMIYVYGNHEELAEQLIERGYPGGHDYSNGTFDTVCDLGGANQGNDFDMCCSAAWVKLKPLFKKTVNYFETKNYIFVHGWIPVKCKDNLPSYYTRNRKFEFNPDWRNAHASEWEQARWLNGMDMARKGFVESEKTIVCGHWHCSYGHMMDDMAKNGLFNCIDEFGETAIWEPYYGNGIIAIDRCTAHTGEVNVLVLEDEFLEE